MYFIRTVNSGSSAIVETGYFKRGMKRRLKALQEQNVLL
jgi:hypothetical protein